MTEPSIHIHADIGQSQTLPSRVYRDRAIFDAQRSAIFARSWQFVGAIPDLVSVPGSAYPFTLLEGVLDEPLLLTRDDDDKIHCLSNVCTHRGNLLVGGAARCRGLRCGYHGRRFKLDGRMEFMPEFEGVHGFPSERDNLARVPVAQWGPLLFVSIDPAVSFEEWIRPIKERVGWLPLNEFRFDARRSRDYLVKCNWALYCDNYLEGFHIPYVHASLNDALDYGSYVNEIYDWSNLQLGVSKGGEHVFNLPSGSPDKGKDIAAYYYWLFPNLMLNFYPWGLSVNVIRPLAEDRTRVSFISYVWDEDKIGQGAGADLDRVEREDEAIVEAVQRGVRSRFYENGRYSPAREKGVHHFHRLMAAALNGVGTTEGTK